MLAPTFERPNSPSKKRVVLASHPHPHPHSPSICQSPCRIEVGPLPIGVSFIVRKAIGLTREKEPEIWDAIRFGALLENVA